MSETRVRDEESAEQTRDSERSGDYPPEGKGALRSAARKPLSDNDEKELRATAYHEAGHTIMRLELGRRVTHVTIKPKGDTLGHVRHRPPKVDVEWFWADWATRRWTETAIMVALAGPEAEKRLMGRRNNIGASGDDAWVAELAIRAIVGDEERNAYLRWLELRVRDFVAFSQFWVQVESVAAALLERETLTGKEVDQIREQALGISITELPIIPPLVTRRSRKIGYAWSTATPPERPDMEGTLAAVRGMFERVHREIRPPLFERLFLMGVAIDDHDGQVSALEILNVLEAQADWDKSARR